MRRVKLLLFAVLLVVLPCGAATAQQQVTAERYVVASGHPAATAVGLEVLRRGGNVIDAAVATSLALGVAEPYGSGLGGKLAMLYRDAATGKVYCIEALCSSAAATDPATFAQLSMNERQYGYQAAGVPGLTAGLYAAHQRWGSLPWAKLVEPAAQLAERGVEISPTMRSLFAPHRKQLKKDAEAARLYLVDDDTPPVGAVLPNADLARSLRMIAQGGPKAFYEGEIAQRIVAAAQAHGSPLSLDDFRNYRPRFTKPLAVCYRGHCVYSSPPPLTGGATVLATLKALEKASAVERETASGRRLHRRRGARVVVRLPGDQRRGGRRAVGATQRAGRCFRTLRQRRFAIRLRRSTRCTRTNRSHPPPACLR